MKTLLIGMCLWLMPGLLFGQISEINDVPVEHLDVGSFADDLSIPGEWQEVIQNSTCLTNHERDQVLIFLSESDPVSPFELQVIEDVPLANLRCLIQEMSEFQRTLTTSGLKKSHIEIFTSMNGEALKRVTLQDPYLLIRSKISTGPTSGMGFTYEKDKYEPFGSTSSGPSFLSAFFEKKFQHPVLKRLIIGDYRLRLGQGLLINNFYRKGLVFNESSIPKHGTSDLKPYTSIDENTALRGMAAKMNFGRHLSLITYASLRQLDGTLRYDSSHTDTILNLSTSGLHVSEQQLKSKNAITVASGGTSYTYETGGMNVSAQFHLDHWFLPISNDQPLYKSQRSKSQLQMTQSVSWDYRLKAINLYGELAIREDEGMSALLGVLWSPNPNHRFSIIYRKVPPNIFLKPRTSLLHAQSGNESGLFLGYNHRWNHLYSLSFNFDSSINSWWSFQNNPFKLTHRISATLVKKRRKHYEVRYAFHLLTRNARSTVTHDHIETKSRLMVHYMQVVTRGIEWRSRGQMTLYHLNDTMSMGWMVYQEIKAKKIGSNFSFNLRLTRYFAPEYENRHYVYESRPAGLFAFPALSGDGIKFTALIRYRHGKMKFSLFASYKNGAGVSSIIGLGLKRSFQ